MGASMIRSAHDDPQLDYHIDRSKGTFGRTASIFAAQCMYLPVTHLIPRWSPGNMDLLICSHRWSIGHRDATSTQQSHSRVGVQVSAFTRFKALLLCWSTLYNKRWIWMVSERLLCITRTCNAKDMVLLGDTRVDAFQPWKTWES